MAYVARAEPNGCITVWHLRQLPRSTEGALAALQGRDGAEIVLDLDSLKRAEGLQA